MDKIKPVRLQRSRKKGFKLKSPNGLPIVYVGRPTKWGNLFRVSHINTAKKVVFMFKLMLDGKFDRIEPLRLAKEKILADIHELEGKNLSCWCPLDKPCHADVLLEIANEVK